MQAPKGASNFSVDAETSEYKSLVFDNPIPSNQVLVTLNQVESPPCFLSFPISTIADRADSCCDL